MLMKSDRRLNTSQKVNELNKLFFTWCKKIKLTDAPLDLSKTLSEIKWGGGVVGLIDVSTLSDLGLISERQTDLLQREIDSLRTRKNEKISLKSYEEALAIGEKEIISRTKLNKLVSYKIFKKHACFYKVDDKKIGFVYRGTKVIDENLEKEIRKVFPSMPTFSNLIIQLYIKKTTQNHKDGLDNQEIKLAA